MSDENILHNSQQILEVNEDIIAAIVENLQLGRLDDCIKHYSVLHHNIVAMASALDNFPSNTCSYDSLYHFEDKIMRKDVLDELRPLGQSKLMKSPLIPPCASCLSKKINAETCRMQLNHPEPSSAFSSQERMEFLRVAQLLEHRDKLEKMENKSPGEKKEKRLYKMWSPLERYIVLLGISKYGTKGSKLSYIVDMLPNRTEAQLRSYIGKSFSNEEIQSALQGILPLPPPDYIPVTHLDRNEVAAAFSVSGPSILEPATGGGSGWASLLGSLECPAATLRTVPEESIIPNQTITDSTNALPVSGLLPNDNREFPAAIMGMTNNLPSISFATSMPHVQGLPSLLSMGSSYPMPPPVLEPDAILSHHLSSVITSQPPKKKAKRPSTKQDGKTTNTTDPPVPKRVRGPYQKHNKLTNVNVPKLGQHSEMVGESGLRASDYSLDGFQWDSNSREVRMESYDNLYAPYRETNNNSMMNDQYEIRNSTLNHTYVEPNENSLGFSAFLQNDEFSLL